MKPTCVTGLSWFRCLFRLNEMSRSCCFARARTLMPQEQLRRFQRWQDIPTAALPTSSGAIAQMAEELATDGALVGGRKIN